MQVLIYEGLKTEPVQAAYDKVVAAILRDDFRAAQVKKMHKVGKINFYRARLNDADRLLFCLIRHADQVVALMLEIIYQHDYGSSRFLRGALVDESKIPEASLQEALQDALHESLPMRYLHPECKRIHILDKPISFDDRQEVIYRQSPPLIIIGSAGSGKTALTLEKLKQIEGKVLYVTHSAYLAKNASDLYFSLGYENFQQESVFLSFREFVESIQVPEGREVLWRDFSAWFARMRIAFRELDAHQVFEEFRGVITASETGTLSRAHYLELGVRQSIFPLEQRHHLYDCFERYTAWMDEAHLYDINRVAYRWQSVVQSEYDFVVVDEVQDLTVVQLALVLKALKQPGRFLLCGDSNQIVHPNFFSWAQIKTLFWKNENLADQHQLNILTANFRNGTEATRVANQLLKIKYLRFGSIDRESNFLVNSVGGAAGQVLLLADTEVIRRDMDKQIRQSTQYAVLVMRDEDKTEARKYFSTPLLFSIHEAKGLEYENIVLFRFVSDHRAEFASIAEGVNRADLESMEELSYHRARDKNDKSLEIYKFFVNALYVAITRAVSNLYILESDARHPLLELLGLTKSGKVQVEAQTSTLEEWQREAHKLELQGKQEQADAIRKTILKQQLPPWPVFDAERIKDTMVKVFKAPAPGQKLKRQLQEYAACHAEPALELGLTGQYIVNYAVGYRQKNTTLGRKSYVHYFNKNLKEVLRQCDQFGVDHRLPMNQTPLMAAAAAGNIPLVEALLERGASQTAVDHYGWNALHWAMREAFSEKNFARKLFPELYELLAPAAVDVLSNGRLRRIDRHLAEYMIFQTLWVLTKTSFNELPCHAIEAQSIEAAWKHLSARVVSVKRNTRQSISAVLSRNERNRDYAYNRFLFLRTLRGCYHLDPKLQVRWGQGEQEIWVPVFKALNLPLINEFVIQKSSTFLVDKVMQTLMTEGGLGGDVRDRIMPPLRAAVERW